MWVPVEQASERFLVAVDGVGAAAATGGPSGRPAGPAAEITGTLGALHLGGRPTEARTDLVGDDLDDGALLSIVGLPAALLEATRDDAAASLGEGGGDVLTEVTPADDIEEGDLLLPLAVDLVAAVDRETEARDPTTAGGEPELGVAGEVPREGDAVRCHIRLPSWCRLRRQPSSRGARPRTRADGSTCGGRCRRRDGANARAHRGTRPGRGTR